MEHNAFLLTSDIKQWAAEGYACGEDQVIGVSERICQSFPPSRQRSALQTQSGIDGTRVFQLELSLETAERLSRVDKRRIMPAGTDRNATSSLAPGRHRLFN